ncbi:MAG: spore germination protein [Sporomusa sp.]
MDNSFFKLYQFIKNILIFKPSPEIHPFVLEETAREQPDANTKQPDNLPDIVQQELKDHYYEFNTLLRQARRLAALMEKAQASLTGSIDHETNSMLQSELERLEKQQQELAPILLSYDNQDRETVGKSLLRSSLAENLLIVNRIYQLPLNKDLIVREITLPLTEPVPAVLLFMDGMVDTKLINLSILQPLLLMSPPEDIKTGQALVSYLMRKILPANQLIRGSSFSELQTGINSGDSVLMIDGINEMLIIGSKGWEHRAVSKPTTEQTIRGSQMAFSENLRVNTALIRTTLHTSDLVTEMITVGERSRVNCAVMYIKSIANTSLVAEVKRRVEGIKTDLVDDVGILEQFIVNHPALPFPQTMSTERPDRVAVHLAEGRVALLLDGNPFALVVPVSMFSLLHSGEDFSLKEPAGTFMRILRVIGAILSMMLPAFYIAISYFHQEALPTELILTILADRENVPFPAYLEMLIMELSFELIREASLRIPNILGSTIGIVGAIILGQAAVAANIVSPIIVVIIAITGLASFTIPEYRFAFAVRIVRFGMLILATVAGLVGLSSGILLLIAVLTSMKSFGIPYLSPIAPKSMSGLDVLVRGSVYRQEKRPDFLNTQDSTRQPHISRRWTLSNAVKGDDEP